MKFINEKSTEGFSFREADTYEVLYDDTYDIYGLLLDGTLFTTLSKDQAKLLELTFKEPEFENFFNSVGIGDEKLNLQPKAACYDDYERPTGDIFDKSLDKLESAQGKVFVAKVKLAEAKVNFNSVLNSMR